jgi:hypothetical protein
MTARLAFPRSRRQRQGGSIDWFLRSEMDRQQIPGLVFAVVKQAGLL